MVATICAERTGGSDWGAQLGAFSHGFPDWYPMPTSQASFWSWGPQSVLFPPAALQSGTGWSMHCYINPYPVTALKLDWHSPAWDSILQAFHRAVGPSLFFTGTLCRIFTQLAAVSAWNSDHPSLMWHTAHSEVRSSTRFICLLTEFQRSLQLPGNGRSDFFLLTEIKYKIFIPRKETVRATGKKSSAFRA